MTERLVYINRPVAVVDDPNNRRLIIHRCKACGALVALQAVELPRSVLLDVQPSRRDGAAREARLEGRMLVYYTGAERAVCPICGGPVHEWLNSIGYADVPEKKEEKEEEGEE